MARIEQDCIKVLKKVKKTIEEYGWAKHTFGSCETGFCLEGAIREHEKRGSDVYCRVRETFQVLIPPVDLTVWNDAQEYVKTVFELIDAAISHLEGTINA